MSDPKHFQPTHVLRLHKQGTRVTIPVHAQGSFTSVTALFTYSEWTAGAPAAWTFNPKHAQRILLDEQAPDEQGWERCELIPIEGLQGGLQ